MVWVVPMAGVHRWKFEKAGKSLAAALNEPLTLMTLKVRWALLYYRIVRGAHAVAPIMGEFAAVVPTFTATN